MKKIYTLLFALLLTGLGFGQTSPGDIAFTAFNADGDDDFAIVALVDLPANTEIYFTDNEPATATTLTGGEGTILWDTGASIISAGTIVTFTDTDSGGNTNFGASVGTLTYQSGSLNLAGGGDALYAFAGTSSTAVTGWLAGIQNEAGNQGGGFASTGLTVGTTFINFFTSGSPDGGEYTGTRAGETAFSDYLSQLGDNTNWTTNTSNGEALLPHSTTAFTIAAGCTAPTTQATAYNTSALGTTSATLNWTSGDGDEVLVVVKEGSAVDTDPTNGTAYTANTAFSSGDELGTGNYVVQSGSSVSSVSVTGLNPATTYHVAVYEYNTLDTCYLTPALTGNFTTDCSVPTDASAFSATAGNTTIDLNWTNGTCFDDVLVVAREASAVSVTPSGDGSAYTADAAFGSGTDLGTGEFVVYQGIGTSETVTGLSNGAEYFFTVFTRKGTSWSTGVSGSAIPNAAPVAGDIVISEIMYNSSGTDDEWIEIYNGSGADITLNSDWRLSYGSSTFDFSGTLITAGSYLTIAIGSNGDGTYNNDNPFTPDVSIIGTPAATINDSNNLVNSLATLEVIYDPSGSNTTIDTVTYDDGSPWPTTPDGNGPSLELVDVTSDNSLAASWVASDLDGGTPGLGYSVTFTFSGSWSPSDPNGTAAAGDNIVIASGDAVISSNTTCNTVTVNPGAGLTVNSSITLTASNGLTLESTSTSYSSLILDGTVTGTLNYERHVNINGSGTTGSNDLISAPLTGQAFNVFEDANPNILSDNEGSPTQHLFGPFDKSTGTYVIYADSETATLDAGIGYRAASNDNSSFTFTGTAENGTITYDIQNSGPQFSEWNLIGNPYPSYINLQDFLNHDLGGGTRNIDIFEAPTAAVYGYDGDATDGYQIYNFATTTASSLIAPGQGFFVSADATQVAGFDVEFTAAMRSTGSSDDFIPLRAEELKHMTLSLIANNKTAKTEFYFNSNASEGLDVGYDASVWGGTASEFSVYSHLVQDNSGNPIALQTLNPSNLADVTIPLGVNANQGEQIRFSITETTLAASVSVYLDDVVANTSTLLNTGDYVITPSSNLSGTGRFFLRTSEDALSTIENSLDNLNVFALNSSKELLVSGQLQDTNTLNLYDIQGRNVLSTTLDNSILENRIDVSNVNTGVYIAVVKNNSQEITKKVIIK